MQVQWCIICQSFCVESIDLLVIKSLVKNQMIKKLTWPWLLRTITCSNYLLPAKFFLSFICRCINLRSISWPSWTQLQRNFLKGYNIQWIKRNLNWLFTYFIFFFGLLCIKYHVYQNDKQLPCQKPSQMQKPFQAQMYHSQFPSYKQYNLKTNLSLLTLSYRDARQSIYKNTWYICLWYCFNSSTCLT